MTITEAIETLNAAIPSADNKMVDAEHLPIALAWGRIKALLASDAKPLKQLQQEIHENAKAHGWWEDPRRPGELFMLITSEVAEAFEEIRNGRAMGETYYSEGGKMEGVPSELADIVIRVLDLAEYDGIDMGEAIAQKHAYNLTRPYKHGGKKL